MNVFTNARLSVRPPVAAPAPTPAAMPIPPANSPPAPRRTASDRSAGPGRAGGFHDHEGIGAGFRDEISSRSWSARRAGRTPCRTGGGPIEPDSPVDLDVIAPILTLLRPVSGKTGRQRQDRRPPPIEVRFTAGFRAQRDVGRTSIGSIMLGRAGRARSALYCADLDEMAAHTGHIAAISSRSARVSAFPTIGRPVRSRGRTDRSAPSPCLVA